MDDLLDELQPQGPTPEERERRRRLIAAVGIAGLSLLTVGTLSSGAWFSDTETVNTGQIVTGSVILSNQPTTVPFAVVDMAPGATEYGSVTVKNTGSLELRYALTANTTAASASAAEVAAAKTPPTGYNLADQLQFSVCSQAFDPVTGACGGTILWNSKIWGDGNTATTSDSMVVFGDPADGTNRSSDQILPAGTSQTLGIKAYLDGPSTGNQWQLTGTSVSLVFNSFQTANNP